MKKSLFVCLCLLGIFVSTTNLEQDVTKDQKPPITFSTNHNS